MAFLDSSGRRISLDEPLRVLLLVKQSSPHWHAAWDDTEAVVLLAVQQLVSDGIISSGSSSAAAVTASDPATGPAAMAADNTTESASLAASPMASETAPAESSTSSSSSPAPSLPPARLLVKHHWGLMIHIVFDVHHTAYDAALAHLPEHNALPVLKMHLGRSSAAAATAAASADADADAAAAAATTATATAATPPLAAQTAPASAALQAKVNAAVADAHDKNGVGSEPPFVEDHRDGKFPVYLYPRRCCPAGPPPGERSYHEGRAVNGRLVMLT
jgi:hypothetical protein